MLLTTMPSFSRGTALSVVKLRGEIRYYCGLPLLKASPKCDSYGTKLTIYYCLGYKVGSLVKTRHDKSRESLTCLVSAGFYPSNSCDEPLASPCRESEEFAKLVGRSTGIATEINTKKVIFDKRLLGEEDGLRRRRENM